MRYEEAQRLADVLSKLGQVLRLSASSRRVTVAGTASWPI